MSLDKTALLETAERVAREAGRILHEGRHDLVTVKDDTGKDLKLKADFESEACIREALAETKLPVIGEEEGGNPTLATGEAPYWVVDPLDGTANYAKGIPLCCVSIGLFTGLKPVLGVIYDFNNGECYSGIARSSEGVKLNGKAVAVNWAPSIEQAHCYAGLPVGGDYSSEGLRRYVTKVQKYKKVRALGSAALGVAYVSVGRFDAYNEDGIMLWDIAAGLALVEAAGGVTRLVPTGKKPLQYNCWAAGRESFIV